MKVAILSDIHSNIFALRAVINDAQQRNVTSMLNLGDILYGPIAPQETFELLQKHNFTTISGNQDRQIYDATQKDIDTNPTLQFILDDLSRDAVEWMRALPKTKQFSEEIYCCHGTPNSDLVYLLENVEKGYPLLRSDEHILDLLAGHRSNIIVCGHTHIPRVVQLSSGQLVINPGSVGLPAYSDEEPVQHSMQTYNNLASYAILEKNNTDNHLNDKWNVELLNVNYDATSAIALAHENNRQDWAIALASGRVM